MKCPNCHEQLGAVVPVISLEAAEADAKRYRDLHEISDECVNDLKEQLRCADAEVRTLEVRLMASRSARRQLAASFAAERVAELERLLAVNREAALTSNLRAAGLQAEVNALTDRLNDMEAANIRRASTAYVEQQERAALEGALRDMTDRYHEATKEAGVLRDRIEHAGAYGGGDSAYGYLRKLEAELAQLKQPASVLAEAERLLREAGVLDPLLRDGYVFMVSRIAGTTASGGYVREPSLAEAYAKLTGGR